MLYELLKMNNKVFLLLLVIQYIRLENPKFWIVFLIYFQNPIGVFICCIFSRKISRFYIEV